MDTLFILNTSQTPDFSHMSSASVSSEIAGKEDTNICQMLIPDEEPLLQHVLFFVKFAVNLFGLFSNFLVVYVYVTKRDKHPSEYLICSLGFIDVFLSLMSLIFMTTISLYRHLLNFSDLFCRLVICTLNASAFIFSTYSSGFLIAVITVNRYVAICYPYDYRTIFTSERVRKLILAGYLFGIVNSTMAIPFCNIQIEVVQKYIDYYYHITRVLLIFGNAAVMIWAYVRVMRELNRHAQNKQTEVSTYFTYEPKQPATRTCSNASEVAYVSIPHSCKTSQQDLQNGCSTQTTGYQVSFSMPPVSTRRGLEASPINNYETRIETDVDQHSPSCTTRCSQKSPKKNWPRKSQFSMASLDPSSAAIGTRETNQVPSPGGSSLRNTIRSSNSKANRKLTKTLFLVSLLFLLCHIPLVVLEFYNFISLAVPTLSVPSEWSGVVGGAHEVMFAVYLAYFDLNPIIYFTCNMYFQTTVKAMFTYCTPR